MKNIYWFKEIHKKDIEEVGGKGANLGEMINNEFPIPDGFCVSSGAYFEFIKLNNIESIIKEYTQDLNVHDTKKLNEASVFIKNAILAGKIPENIKTEIMDAYNKLCQKYGEQVYVAVRSSATAEDLAGFSFAGQQSTFLNIQGPEDVVQSVKDCWASLFESRAIFYRTENKFDHLNVGLSAVVQKMVQSEVAGVAFTVDPISQDKNSIQIEGAYGLGEAVVSGALTPDRYSITKDSLEIKERYIAHQTWKTVLFNGKNENVDIVSAEQDVQKLSDAQIIELAKICRKIEKHYGVPQDIEWAFENDRLYIVQSRPITTLDENKDEISNLLDSLADTDGKYSLYYEEEDSPSYYAPEGVVGEVLLKGLGASPGIYFGKVKLTPSNEDIDKVEKGDILVTSMTSPDFVPAMKRAGAIITDHGGSTSHAAIVSRELGIPCIVGTNEATKKLSDGMEITVDAIRGIVYEGIVDIKNKNIKKIHKNERYSPITGTKIYVNLASSDRVEEIAEQNVDGIGLLRAEFIIADMGEHPRVFVDENRQEEFINNLAIELRKFASAFYPRPVVYRATDFKTNEYRSLKGGEKYEMNEENPMMGFRGASRYVSDPEVFKMELEAIKKVRDEFNLKNLWLMIPFVRRVGELMQVKRIMHNTGLFRTKDFKLWMMVEVPSTVILLDEFIDVGIDGVSVGTNDLTQLTLGVDRDNARLAHDFDERNSAVLKSLKHIGEVCNKRNITCSVCGQAPSVYPEFAKRLVEYGFTSMSVNPDTIERTRRIVASAESALMLKHARVHLMRDKDDWLDEKI
ncbi:phosphoenolpyruvate synthase [Candidatus Micrarchaeota archaeon]|nr:phosphoenolpyruvate synthase [Candidatus Micrarchaeota archaeon]